MSKAKFRKVYGKVGSGRFVVSEGIAPSTFLYPSSALPTLYSDAEDDRFETVLTMGTIISVKADSNGDSVVVPANGTNATKTHNDGAATPETITVGTFSTPVGVLQQDAYRPFDKGNSIAASWITRGFVEWPLITGLNDTLVAGDLVRSDNMGRPVKCTTVEAAASPWTVVGKVIETETFATNFDDGLLSYMQLPSDPGALKLVYEISTAGTYTGKLGIRANLDQAGSVGAFRVTLNL